MMCSTRHTGRTLAAIAASIACTPMAAEAQVAAAWTAFEANPDTHPNIPNVMHSGYKGGGVGFPDDTGRQIVNVASFGAAGDGVADDTAAVRAALNFAELAEPSAPVGVTVFFPAGTYRLSGPLLVHSDRTILRGADTDTATLLFTESLETSYADFDLGGGNSGWSFNGGLVWFTDESRNDYFTGVPTISGIGDNWQFGGPSGDVTQPAVRGDRTITVQNAGSFSPGDAVIVEIDNAPDFSTLLHLLGDGTWANNYPFSMAADAKILPDNRSSFRAVHTIESVSGGTVTLREPLRFDLRSVWNPELRTPLDMRRDVGIASLTIQMDRDYDWNRADHHSSEPGFNPLCFSNVIDGFASDLRLVDPGGLGAIINYSAFVTLSEIVMDSSGPDRERHHHGFAIANTHHSLVDQFEINTRPYHGAYVANTSMGNVYSRGVMLGGTFDYHRLLPYENVYTEISITNDGVASGSSTSGPRTGARAAHWNVDTRATGGRIISQPNILPKGALVGVRCATILEPLNPTAGDPEALIESVGPDVAPVDPPNLYLAQLELRDAQPITTTGGAGFVECPCNDEEPYDFDFGGAVGDDLIGQDGWRYGRDFNNGNGLLVRLGLESHPEGPVLAAVSESGQDSVISRLSDDSHQYTPFTFDQTDAIIRFDVRAGISGGGSGDAFLILNNFEGFDDGLQFGMSSSRFRIRANRFGSDLDVQVNIPSGWHDRGDWARLELRIDFTSGAHGEASMFFQNLTDADPGFSSVPGLQNIALSDEVRYPESWDRIEFRIRNDAAAANIVANVGALGTLCPSPCSPADLDGDGAHTFADALLFIMLFNMNDPIADWDNDGLSTFFDAIEYLRDFDAGC
ncbi:MAG: glycosyl hydrolase family 28-related protein [Planctomycetota bacterium]